MSQMVSQVDRESERDERLQMLHKRMLRTIRHTGKVSLASWHEPDAEPGRSGKRKRRETENAAQENAAQREQSELCRLWSWTKDQESDRGLAYTRTLTAKAAFDTATEQLELQITWNKLSKENKKKWQNHWTYRQGELGELA